MAVAEGGSQTGTVAEPLAVKPAVKITDQNSQPASGVAVTFAVASGGGSVTGASATTDASGVARAGDWTLGQTAGAQTLSATANVQQGSPVTFTATANPGPAAAVSKDAGDAQAGTVGAAVAVAPALKVTDAFGNGVSGIGVLFAVTQGNGAVTQGTQTTGPGGVATVGGWTLGQTAGPNAISAAADGTGLTGNPAAFTATANPGPPATVTKKAGDNQSALAGQAVAVAPQVEVADQFGNTIGGGAVNFAVASGGGSVTGSAATADGSGLASVGSWTLGGTPGANTLTATAGAIVATFTATGLAALDAAQYAGTYTGTWTNTTFSSTGTASATITVDQGTKLVSAAITVTGNVLGSSGVAPTNQQANYDDTGATFTGTLPVMGDITATIDAAGNIVASGVNVPNAGITRWDANGTVTAHQLRLDFTVTFTAGAPAQGTISLDKP